MGSQVIIIWAASCNEQVCFRLFRSSAKHLRHVTISYKHICLDSHCLLELCHLLRSASYKRLFPPGIDVVAAMSP